MTAENESRDPLQNPALMARLISEVTGAPVDQVTARLRDEFSHPGSSVAKAFRARGLRSFEAGPGMDLFYQETDAFLYETAVWNRNLVKRQMRNWIIRHLRQFATIVGKPSLDVLMLGDGMGFDSVAISSAGHRVTYMELPSLQIGFATRLFDLAGQSIRMVTDPGLLDGREFDVVVALDVLEHVPDPPAFVRMMAGYLRPGGRLVSHAPFYMIHPSYPTHLAANRRFSGSLRLYTDAGLHLVDGQSCWNPLVLEKPADGVSPTSRACPFRFQPTGLYLMLGRISTLPFHPLHWYRRTRDRWFGQ